MAETKVIYNDSERLVYLDPNNIEVVDGVPVTPDYTDYCLMFRLMADVVNRMDVVGVDGSAGTNDKVAITWFSSQKEGGKSEKIYFTRGSKIDSSERNYYTTYYTGIPYRDFSDDDIVEGLGVESIDIAIENFYAVSVKIKFIDVMGISLFGPEEHSHKNTRLTSNGIYGCFFTMPYPKFSLQVKGYYGKAVTYQLTCTDFRGSFNANTGNFEAAVSFIGYDFSCLSDLPLRYVILSPCDTTIGSQYWDEHVKNDPSWQLIGPDGPEEPKKLIDVYKNIKNAVNSNVNFDVNTFVEAVGIVEINMSISEIEKLKTEYIKAINDSLAENNEQIKLYQGSKLTTNGFYESGGTQFNGAFNLTVIGYNISGFSIKNPDFASFFRSIDNYNNENPENEIKYNKENFIYVKETTIIHEKEPSEITYIFDDGGVYKELLKKSNELQGMSENIAAPTENTSKIKEILEFTPYIGNVVKLLLCHVETFIYTVYMTASNIYTEMNNGIRTSKYLGLNINNTDISRLNQMAAQRFANDIDQIPPFPSVIITDSDTNPEKENSPFNFQRNGWPGDLGDNKTAWQEYNLISGYVDASQRRDKADGIKEATDVGNDVNELMCSSYIFFKNLWDRWLVSKTIDEFTVKNMYKDFVFVDSFYRSIEWKLHINADVLMKCIENKNNDSTVYSMLRDLAKEHNTLFFSYSDSLLFTDGIKRNNAVAKKNVEKIFTPVPFKDIDEISTSNKTVFFYQNKPASNINSGTSDFSDDNMYFSDGEKLTEFANKAFANVNNSYVVPSFAVVFTKQANTFFTNVTVKMDVPVVTSETIKTVTDIGSMYSGSQRKVSFYGQDLFPVYTNYSYICEFDMLGDVQITPLMYFQLFNIPVFRGVYMIYSVKHSMRQGDMITHVKGMRMSKEAIPFSNKWFSDGFDLIFREYGVTNNIKLYDSIEEINIVKPCEKYKNANEQEIIDLVIDLNGGYFQDSSEKVLKGRKNQNCYCNILRFEDYSDDSIKIMWEKLGEENLTDGYISNNEDVKSNLNEYFSQVFDKLNLSDVDVFVATHALAHFFEKQNMILFYKSANQVYGTKFNEQGIMENINQDIKNLLKRDKIYEYRETLAKNLKFDYQTVINPTLRTYLLSRVDECTRKINETFCVG